MCCYYSSRRSPACDTELMRQASGYAAAIASLVDSAAKEKAVVTQCLGEEIDRLTWELNREAY